MKTLSPMGQVSYSILKKFTDNKKNMYLGIAKKCESFVRDCKKCTKKGQCSQCYEGFFLYDSSQNGFYDKCVKCLNLSGCADLTLIYEKYTPDGSGKYEKKISLIFF
jgi:hypothetical protein